MFSFSQIRLNNQRAGFIVAKAHFLTQKLGPVVMILVTPGLLNFSHRFL